MNDKFFLNTNAFVYSFDGAAAAKSKKAESLIRFALVNTKGVISYHVIQEFFNVADRRFPEPMGGAGKRNTISRRFSVRFAPWSPHPSCS